MQELLAYDREMVKALLKKALQEVLVGEMRKFLGAQAHERTEGRKGSCAGYDQRRLVTRIGTMELRVLRDRSGALLTVLFERDARRGKALVGALAEMYGQGVWTRKGKAITEGLSAHSFLCLGDLEHQQGT